MKNSDAPAMPTPVIKDSYGDPIMSKDWDDLGLTKREHFAAMAQVPMEILREALKDQYPDGFSVDNYIDVAVAYKLKEADALLKALEDNT